MRKALNLLFVLCSLLIVCAYMLISGTRFFGLLPYVVTSGSMSPSIPMGSMVYIDEGVPQEGFEAGDVIAFRLDADTVATHRIVEVLEDETGARSYRTKGDHNDSPDARPVAEQEIVGRMLFSLPLVGSLGQLACEAAAKYVVIGVIVVLGLLSIVCPEQGGKAKTAA